MRYVLWYQGEFTISAAIMFGAIISATDPVAVVALLKELGASRRLATLIEGESLLNDGTAMVMFAVMLSIVKEEETTVPSVILFFCRLSFGGPILGILFGLGMSFWLKRILNDPTLEVNLTVFGAYLLFYTAESVLKVSGILALVALGLYMTRSGKTRISSASEHAMHYIWGMIGFVAETIIFMLTGVIVAIQVLKADTVIGINDYWKLLVLYLCLHVIRFSIVYSSGWFISLIGYKLDTRQMAVLSYGGLRGAVGLSLALIVKLDTKISPVI